MKHFYTLPLTLLALQANAANTSKLEEVFVTANRAEQKFDAVTAPVTLFTRADIEQLQPTSVIDLLRLVPGVNIASNGGKGSTSGLFLRGTENGHTLVLVDGQRISSATLGETAFQFLDPDQIERIEVLRGPRSSLYGSEAVGGVIHIMTRKADKDGVTVKLVAGNRKTGKAVVSASTRDSNTELAVNLSHFNTNGINHLDTAQKPQADQDAYRNSSAGVNIGHRVDNKLKIGFSVFNTQSMNEYDSRWSYYPYTESEIFSQRLSADYNASHKLNLHAEIGRSTDESISADENKQADPSVYQYITDRDSLLLQANLQVNKQIHLSYGSETITDRIDTDTQYFNKSKPVDSRDYDGVFMQGEFKQGLFTLGLGGRNDNIEGFGDKATGNVSVSMQAHPDLRITASLGTAFKAPSFNDLYFPDSPWSSGNPDLKPEESENREVEFKLALPVGSTSLNIFRNDIENLIEWTPDADYKWTPQNVGKVNIEGHELTYQADVAAVNINSGIAFTEARDALTDKLLRRRPLRTGFIQLDHHTGAFSSGVTLKAQSQSQQDDANTVQTGGFATIDLRTGYQLYKETKLSLTIDNALDKRYQVVDGYNTEARTYLLGVQTRF